MTAVAIVEDDLNHAESIIDNLEEKFTDLKCSHFEYLYDLAKSTSSFDLTIIDISAVCGLLMRHTAYSPILNYIDSHPGVPILIMCGLGGAATKEVVDDVIERCVEKPMIKGCGQDYMYEIEEFIRGI